MLSPSRKIRSKAIIKSQKLVLVSTISTLLIEAINKINLETQESEIQWVLCIYYPTQLGEFSIETLIDLDSEVNAM